MQSKLITSTKAPKASLMAPKMRGVKQKWYSNLTRPYRTKTHAVPVLTAEAWITKDFLSPGIQIPVHHSSPMTDLRTSHLIKTIKYFFTRVKEQAWYNEWRQWVRHPSVVLWSTWFPLYTSPYVVCTTSVICKISNTFALGLPGALGYTLDCGMCEFIDALCREVLLTRNMQA